MRRTILCCGLSFLLLATTQGVMAQRVKLERGDLSGLGGIPSFALEFRYDSMTVSRKHVPEREYVDDRIDELNGHRRNRGDTWAAGWRRKRAELYEPAFRQAFEAQGFTTTTQLPDTGWLIIFTTTHIESGYNVGIRRRSSRIDGEARIVPAAHQDEVKAVISIKKCFGRTDDGYDFNAGQRLAGSYEVAGTALGRFLKFE